MYKINCILCCTFLYLSYNVFSLDFSYHDHNDLTNFIQNFGDKFPNVYSKYYSIGQSVNNRDLWVLEITGTNNKSDIVAVPNIKFIGNIHGNEAIGREILVHFTEYLSTNYLTDPEVTHLLNNTRLYIMPSMNPDGFAIASEGSCDGEPGRTNACDVDLNRNFPDQYLDKRPRQKGTMARAAYEPEACQLLEQPETIAVRNWMNRVPFVLSASLHGGALVANYPFDSSKTFSTIKEPAICPDDDVFKHLATTYANTHAKMHFSITCGSNVNFNGGITNGAAWYALRGGMQDYNYVFHGCMELTLELSCCKYPMSRKIKSFWEDNKNALLKYALLSQQGVKGSIKDKESDEAISNATLKILRRDIEFRTSKQGEFWRVLLPGNYTLQIIHDGYHNEHIEFTVHNFTNFPVPTVLTIYMRNISSPTELFFNHQYGNITTTTIELINDTRTFPTPKSFPVSELDKFTINMEMENSNNALAEESLSLTSASRSIYYNIYNGLFVLVRLLYEFSQPLN